MLEGNGRKRLTCVERISSHSLKSLREVNRGKIVCIIECIVTYGSDLRTKVDAVTLIVSERHSSDRGNALGHYEAFACLTLREEHKGRHCVVVYNAVNRLKGGVCGVNVNCTKVRSVICNNVKRSVCENGGYLSGEVDIGKVFALVEYTVTKSSCCCGERECGKTASSEYEVAEARYL